MVVMIVLAAGYGLVQCVLLGSWVRSVRWRTLVAAVFAGAYAAAVVSVALQWAWTRGFAAVSGVSLNRVVTVASYTVDPVIEELVKVAAVLVVWRLVASVRATWGFVDLVLVAAGVGTGFGITEALLRFGGASHRVLLGGVFGDWTLPGGLFGAYTVPGPVTALGQWVPAGVQVDSFLSSAPTDAVDVHLVWSGIAGLGLALLLRGTPSRSKGRSRWVGVGLIGFAAADHMANNTIGQGGVPETVGAPLGWLRQVIWAYPLVVLAAATVLDRRVLAVGRSADSSVLVGAGPGSEAGVLARLTLARPRAPVVWSFVLARRAYWTAIAAGHSVERPAAELAGELDGELAGRVRGAAGVLRAAGGPDGGRVWERVDADRAAARCEASGQRARVVVGVWLVLLAGPFAYFVIGGVPAWSAIQAWLSTSPGFWILLLLAAAGMGWTAWRLRAAVLAWPRVRGLAAADVPAVSVLTVGTQVAALGIGAVSVYLAARGVGGDAAVVTNFHILDAISSVLLVGGIALMLLAIAADPPLALVLLAGGGSTLMWTGISAATADALLTGTAVATTGAGIHYMTGDSGDEGGPASSGGGTADLPQQPPRPKPAVRDWKLRRIVDNLWHGADNPQHLGDGTTMDAVRNELRTGRATGGRFHSQKAREAIDSLLRWQRQFGSGASREDRLWAERLISELRKALGGQ